MNHYENKILSSDSDIETIQTHIKELPKQKLQDELQDELQITAISQP